ncbi:neurogenic locus notch homolog protein 2-like isoform X1 [Lytechinus variegatus]|uniref:neurogenic locus notch homolog protein 2-like isoform X1 n=1 Tax=Lytechinus variegatus TaxID=7654 RepID=UPI001BB0DB78|nr:neurogenic locus notch homolog protein 2-like isoform X1 [Lytechinus variegatus]
MTIKGKDFKKAVSFIKEFLMKLPEDPECAELRDNLNLALLHMKKYFKTVWLLQEKERNNSSGDKLAQSLPRGSGPSSLHQDDPDRFHWKWVSTDRTNPLRVSLPLDGKELPVLPLILQATKEGDKELVEQLIDKEPMCVHASDDLGRNAVMYAAHYDKLDCMDVLLTAHADPSVRSKDNYTACHVAVHGGNWEALEKLLAHDADTETQDNIGRAPLHWAALLPDIDCLDMLLKADVNRSPRDCDGLTPAMWACHVDNKTHFDLITSGQHKVEEDDGIERDLLGRTWIHWSVKRSESLECLDSLLSPATAAIKDKEGRTAIHLAASLGALDACRLVVSKVGPDSLNETDNHDRTCLHLATIGGHGEVVNFLLDHGADVNRLDRSKKTAWDYAEEKDLHYCKLIIESYCSPRERTPSRGRNRHRGTEVNNNSIPNSGNNPSSQSNHQQLSPDHEGRIPSPPHQPRPFIQALPPPKRGHSPRRPSPNRPTHPHTGMVHPAPQSQLNDEPLDGPNHSTQEEGSAPLESDIVISPVDSEQGKVVQYRPPSEGEIVQSQEGAIIDSDMQPSSQVAEKEEQAKGPRNPRGRSCSVVSDMSEQSINFGMDVSDIEGEDGTKESGRVNERLIEPVPSPGWKSQPTSQTVVNQKLPIPPRPPSPALAPTSPPHPLSSPTSPSHTVPSSTSPSAPPMPQITPFTKAPLQGPQSPPPSAPPQQQQQQQKQPKQQQGLTGVSPRRLMPLADPLVPQTLPPALPETGGGTGSSALGGKGKKKKKRKGSAGGGKDDWGSLVAPHQPIAPIRSPTNPPEPDFALRPPSPGFLSAPGHPPNSNNHHPTPSNQHSPSPTPTPRNLNRSPQPPVNHHQPHQSQELAQVAPLQAGGGVSKTQQHQGQNRNGAWEVSWEPKRPGMPAPPVTPRDNRGGGGLPSPGSGSLLPQATSQGGMLLDRGNSGGGGAGGGGKSPRGSSPQPAQISPRGSKNKSGSHNQGGLTELQRPRTPQMPVTARFPDTRGRTSGSLPAHPPPGRP